MRKKENRKFQRVEICSSILFCIGIKLQETAEKNIIELDTFNRNLRDPQPAKLQSLNVLLT